MNKLQESVIEALITIKSNSSFISIYFLLFFVNSYRNILFVCINNDKIFKYEYLFLLDDIKK